MAQSLSEIAAAPAGALYTPLMYFVAHDSHVAQYVFAAGIIYHQLHQRQKGTHPSPHVLLVGPAIEGLLRDAEEHGVAHQHVGLMQFMRHVTEWLDNSKNAEKVVKYFRVKEVKWTEDDRQYKMAKVHLVMAPPSPEAGFGSLTGEEFSLKVLSGIVGLLGATSAHRALATTPRAELGAVLASFRGSQPGAGPRAQSSDGRCSQEVENPAALTAPKQEDDAHRARAESLIADWQVRKRRRVREGAG